jgi:hypothetical protein
MKKWLLSLLFTFLCLWTVFSAADNFNTTLVESINTSKDEYRWIAWDWWLQKRLQWMVKLSWSEWMKDFILFLAIKVLFPITVLSGIVVAFIGFYKVMTSDKEDEQKKGTRFLLWGTIWVVTMVMASFITTQLVWTTGVTWIFWVWDWWSIFKGSTPVAWQQIAQQIYSILIFPILKMGMMVIIGILFITLFINLFQYLFSPAEDIQKKALTIIIWNTVGILTIVLAKYIVEFIFGKYDTVVLAWNFQSWSQLLNSTTKSNLGKIGTPLWEIKLWVSMEKLFTILNRLLGLLTLAILIMIIYQGFRLLFNPTDAWGLASVGKSLGYIFLGILLLGFGYLIANAIIPVP